METSPPPRQTINLSTPLYYQLVYTLNDLLPPPLDGSSGALRTRNHAATAKVAALLPVNANKLDLAAQCIAARAQAEDVLRLLRENADDIQLVLRLNAQYSSMVRASLSVHGRLMKVQALRQKRDAIEGTANQDAWTMHITEQSMLKVTDPDIERLAAVLPKAAPAAAPAPHVDPTIEKNAPGNKTNSHNVAFETPMSNQPRNQVPRGPVKTDTRSRLREAITELGWDLPANGRESPGWAA